MEKPSRDTPPSCNRCVHYYITHDANFRYGCRAFNFKSSRQPMLDVIEASGEACHHFQQKQRKAE
jgi:hypothetical protein